MLTALLAVFRVHPLSLSTSQLKATASRYGARWRLRTELGRFLRGATWNLLGTVVGQGLSYFASLLCARMLGREQFGQVGIILTTVNLFTSVAGFGMGVAATKLVAEVGSQKPERARYLAFFAIRVTLVLGLGFGAVQAIASPFIARRFLGDPSLAMPLALSGLIVLTSAVNGTQVAILNGYEAFRQAASVTILRGAVTVPSVLIMAHAWGVTGVVAGYAVAGVVAAVLLQRGVRIYSGPPSPLEESDRRQRRRLVRLGGAVVAASMLPVPVAWWTNTFFARKAGFAEYGAYAAANQVVLIAQLVTSAMSATFLPLLASSLGKDGASGLRRGIVRLGSAHFLATLMMTLCIALLAPMITRLYGPSFRGTDAVLILLVASLPFVSLNGTMGHVLWVQEASRLAIGLSLVRAALQLVMVIWLAPFGARGFAMAQTASAALVLLTCAPIVWRRLPHSDLQSADQNPIAAYAESDSLRTMGLRQGIVDDLSPQSLGANTATTSMKTEIALPAHRFQ